MWASSSATIGFVSQNRTYRRAGKLGNWLRFARTHTLPDWLPQNWGRGQLASFRRKHAAHNTQRDWLRFAENTQHATRNAIGFVSHNCSNARTAGQAPPSLAWTAVPSTLAGKGAGGLGNRS